MNTQTVLPFPASEMNFDQYPEMSYVQFSETVHFQVSEPSVAQSMETANIQISEMAEAVLALGKKRHENYRIITDFRGPIHGQAFSLDGMWRYLELTEEDRKIIPKAAYKRHAAAEKIECRVSQVLIGHEISDIPIAPVQPKPEVVIPEVPVVPPKPKPEIDWGSVAQVVGKGLMIGMTGIAMIPLTAFAALAGGLLLIDPSYCIVLDDGQGTVIELIRWNLEV